MTSSPLTSTPAALLDAILTDVPADVPDDLALLAFDDDEVGARLDSFAADMLSANELEIAVRAVMLEAAHRLSDDPGPF